jgi:hypothetical protein
MAVFKDLVLLSELNSNKLINMYDQTGKLVNSFGNCYQVNHPILSENGRYKLNFDLIINWGEIVCSDKYIYFISSLFGDIYKFDQKGRVIEKEKLEGDEFFGKNRKFYFSNAVIKESKNSSLPFRVFFKDAIWFENKIYLLLMDRGVYGEIWQLDESRLEIENKYSFFNIRDNIPIQTKSRSIGIFRQEDCSSLHYYISSYSSGEFFIDVYKRNIFRR